PAELRVADAMTRDAVTVPVETPLRRVVELLLDRDYRALPVLDAQGRVVGIVTNTDLVERGGLAARLELLAAADAGALRRELERIEAEGRTAAEVMTPRPRTTSPERRLSEAAH